MSYSKIVVFGSTSSIAKLIIPELKIDHSVIFSIDRVRNFKSSQNLAESRNHLLVDYGDAELTHNRIIEFLDLPRKEPMLIMNFSGNFGEVAPLKNLRIDQALATMEANIKSYLTVTKIGTHLAPGSLIISFSGAGIGGSNLDDSSLGYLTSKAGISILNEAIDKQLQRNGVRSTLISPGAFPSPMQSVVAEAGHDNISETRIADAKRIMSGIPNTSKLLRLVLFLMNHPEVAGGRIWSANFDLLSLENKVSDFGYMRRIFE